MKTPKCHRTFAVPVYMGSNGSYDCIGSACAMWVPEFDNGTHGKDSILVANPSSHDLANATLSFFTGLGWCADNPNREPWPDPAKGGDDA